MRNVASGWLVALSAGGLAAWTSSRPCVSRHPLFSRGCPSPLCLSLFSLPCLPAAPRIDSPHDRPFASASRCPAVFGLVAARARCATLCGGCGDHAHVLTRVGCELLRRSGLMAISGWGLGAVARASRQLYVRRGSLSSALPLFIVPLSPSSMHRSSLSRPPLVHRPPACLWFGLFGCLSLLQYTVLGLRRSRIC